MSTWDQLKANWAQWIVDRPIASTLIALLFCIPPSLGLLQLDITANPRTVLGEHHPVIQRLVELEYKYIEENNFLVMLKPQEGDIFNPDFLEILKRFTDDAWLLPQVRRVDSMTNFQYTESVDGDLVVTDLVEDPASLSPDDLARIRHFALTDQRLTNILVASDGEAAGVNMIFNVDLSDVKGLAHIQAVLGELRNTAETENLAVKTYETGMLGLVCAWNRLAAEDMRTIYPAATLLIFFGLLFFYRNLRATMATLLVAALSATTGTGTIGVFGGVITPMTILGTLMIGMLALANSVHIINTTKRLLNQGQPIKSAVAQSLDENFKAVALTSLTTAIGFISFGFNESVQLAHMGRYVAFGMVAAFVTSVTLLPVLLCHCRLKAIPKSNRDHRYLVAANLVIRFRWTLLLITAPTMFASMYVAQLNRIDDGMSYYIHDTDYFRTDTDFIQQELTGMASLVYDLDSGLSDGINNPDFIADVDRFVDWLRRQPEVHQVASYTDTLKQLNYNMHDDQQEWYKSPDSQELAAQYLLLYEMSLPYGLDLTTQMDMYKSSARVVAIVDDLGTYESLDLVQLADDQLAQINPDIATTASGTMVANNYIIQSTIRSTLISAVTALIVIGTILLFTFRAIMPGILSVLMVISPLLVAFSWWALTVGYIGTPATISICMVIGIVVDNAVHFLTKYLRNRRAKQLSPEDSIRETFVTVSSALVVNAAVLAGGFGLFLFSSFQYNTVMGQLTSMSVLLSLVGALTLLPCLLLFFEQFVPVTKRYLRKPRLA